jgi:hypothetical protein
MREYECPSGWTPWHVVAVVLILGVLVVGPALVYRGLSYPPGICVDEGDSTP